MTTQCLRKGNKRWPWTRLRRFWIGLRRERLIREQLCQPQLPRTRLCQPTRSRREYKKGGEPGRLSAFLQFKSLRAAEAFPAIQALITSSIAHRDMPTAWTGGSVGLEMSNGVTQSGNRPY